MKKIISIMLTLCFVLSFQMSTFAQSAPTIVNTDIRINGQTAIFEKPILNIDGSTYFPMRELLNKLGVDDKNIIWYPDMRYIEVYVNNQIIIIDADSNSIIKNGEELKNPTKPYNYNGSIYLPIRPVAAACDFNVTFDETTRAIYVNTKK